MNERAESSQGLNVDQVLRLHEITKDVSKFFESQLRTYLQALNPLFRPRRILGEYVEAPARESAVGAETNLEQLKELYKRASGRPIELHSQLTTPIQSISTQLQIHPWDYIHNVDRGGNRKKIAVRSPLSWVVSYPSTYSLSMFREVLRGDHERDQSHLGAFVLRACMMSLMFEKLPELRSLIEGLRYRVEIRKSSELGDLPLVTLSAPFPTIRPADEIVLLASGVSGGSAFEEILDLEATRQLPDPLKKQIQELLEPHGEKL